MAGAWNIGRFQSSASVAPLFIALVVAIVAVVLAWPGSAGYKDENPLYEVSRYPEVADDVARLGLTTWDGSDRDCTPNFYAGHPCLDMVPLWRDFAARHELGENRRSADMFQAYIGRGSLGSRGSGVGRGGAPGTAITDRGDSGADATLLAPGRRSRPRPAGCGLGCVVESQRVDPQRQRGRPNAPGRGHRSAHHGQGRPSCGSEMQPLQTSKQPICVVAGADACVSPKLAA